MSDLSKRITQLSPAQLGKLTRRLTSKEATPLVKIAPRKQGTNIIQQSYAQQRLWILDRLHPGNPAYNITMPMRFFGGLNVAVLERVLSEIVRRHESLRTRFSSNDDSPVQIIDAPLHVDLPIVDLTHLPAGKRETEARRLANQYARQPFNLSQTPLWHAHLLRLSTDDHVLLFIMHHIITDAWSLSVLSKEINELYRAFSAGQPSPLAELPIQYADYAVWQTEWLRGSVLDEQLSYWKQNLNNAPALLDLPSDRPRPPVQTFNGARLSLHLSKTLSEALVELSRAQDVTLFMTLLAAFKVLLYRYSGQTDIVVGSAVANRKSTDGEKLIGFFANTLAIRTDLSGNPTFRDFLQQVRKVSLGAFSHQDVPFERVVEEILPERKLSHSPLFQAAFALHNVRMEPWDLPDLTLSSIEIDSGYVKFDILLSLMNSEQGIYGQIEYNTDLFVEPIIKRMISHLQELLEGVVVAPDRRLLALPLLTADERSQLSEWNNTKSEYPFACIQELIERQVDLTPDAIAVKFEELQLSYAELNSRANQLGNYLQARGVGPEVLVAILMDRSVDIVVALLGVLKAGGAYVPLDANYPVERLRYMLQDSGSGVVLTQGRLTDLVTRFTLGVTGVQVVCMDEQWSEIALESKANLSSSVAAENLAYVIYTSGSTGAPKSAMIPHRALTNHMCWIQEACWLGEGDVVLQKTPFSFDVAVGEFLWPLMSGARLVMAKDHGELESEYLIRLIEAEKITTINFVASSLPIFLAHWKTGICHSLKYVFCGGEAMPLHVEQDFFSHFPNVKLHNVYGPTETTITATSWACKRESGWRSVPIGRPITNTSIYLLDADLQPVPVNVAGEMYICGANLSRGYWQRPELTAEKFIPNPFSNEAGSRLYRTGDLARYLADGNIEFVGRIDYQVKVRGLRIELGEIEAALSSHDSISECVTVTTGDKRIVAYVVPGGDEINVMQLRNYLRERLPEYMVPGAFVKIESLPRTPTGKIDRSALPELDVVPREAIAPYAEPRNELEQGLARIWREVLRVEQVGLHDNFFDLGGHSLLLIQVHDKLRKQMGWELSALDLFKYPTIAALAEYLSNLRGGEVEQESEDWLIEARNRAVARRRGATHVDSGVAIIGMAGRLPGANSLAEFWENLRNGVEAMREFSEAELRAAGVSDEWLQHDHFVRLGVALDGVEYFDAEFFGITPREAELMDPQQRLFLECAWEALENAGYDSHSYHFPIGIFAGAGTNSYMFQLMSNRQVFQSIGAFQARLLNDKDFLATRASYKLGLSGPSMTVQTACSTSLVAVHLACQSLLNGECSMALAGGVAIVLPQRSGYLYQDGGIMSPDGRCRAFDARAAGTVGGSGAGAVLLKRLSDALADGDSIRAVIKGSAVNNDGALKVGYTAPSINGQAAVIAEAQMIAGVSAETISYVEAHGTATPLGDPIEVAALTQAFRAQTTERQFCALGSVKTNIGHLDAAAGVAGLIKTVLALEHQQLPPSLYFEQPNPNIDFAHSPFYVNVQLQNWPRQEGKPRRAGVSSFGIGGTNAHLIVEEAPLVISGKTTTPVDEWQVLMLSARTADSLAAGKQQLATHLEQHQDQVLADVAYTLQVGRRSFSHRAALVCHSRDEAVAMLRTNDPQKLLQSVHESAERPVAFVFPGVGDHYVEMAAGVYRAEETFRATVDHCAELLRPHLNFDLRDILYPARGLADNQALSPIPQLDLCRMLGRDENNTADVNQALNQTYIAQPTVFVIEYAMAKLLMSWGVRPQAMIGYSVGEYVAACLAGVLALEDALFLISKRARMIQDLPTGAMLAVPLSETEIRTYLSDQIWLAAINSPALSVLAGSAEAIAHCKQKLLSRNLACRRLPTTHPFHSELLSPIAGQFTELVKSVKVNAPNIPYISNVTGMWITEAELQDPEYWARHMCRSVRFADGLSELWREPGRILLELGPGQSLTSLALQQRTNESTFEQVALPTIRNSYEQRSDMFFLLNTVAKLWLAGFPLDWRAIHRNKTRKRVSLPTYNFDRQYYWLPQSNGAEARTSVPAPQKKPEVANWFYLPSWKRTVPLSSFGTATDKQAWLIFLDRCGIGSQIAALLEKEGHEVVTVSEGEEFQAHSARSYTLSPARRNDYESMFSKLQQHGWKPGRIVHLWSLQPDSHLDSDHELFDKAQGSGFYSLLYLAQALGRTGGELLRIDVVTDQIQEVTGEETLRPERATILGPCKVIPQEYPEAICRSIDIILPLAGSPQEAELAQQLVIELQSKDFADVVAHRRGYRWIQHFEPFVLEVPGRRSRFSDGGTFLLVGGLGKIGLTLAKHIASKSNVRLVLTGRSGLPPRDTWEQYLENWSEAETAARIKEVLAIESLGAEVCVLKADAINGDEMREVINQTRKRFGPINGVIYLAGLVGPGSFSPLQETGISKCELQFDAKARGLYVLEEVLEGLELDFCVVFSSLASVLGGLGFTAYASANIFIDAFVRKHNRSARTRWISENWDTWLVRDVEPRSLELKGMQPDFNMTKQQGIAAFEAILSAGVLTQVIVSVGGLHSRLSKWIKREVPFSEKNLPASPGLAGHPRPALRNAFVAPRDEIERGIAGIWQEVLGIEMIGVYDNFFELGGHSLLGTQVISRLRKKFHEDLSVRTVLTALTIAELAEVILQRRAEQIDSAAVAQLITEVRQSAD